MPDDLLSTLSVCPTETDAEFVGEVKVAIERIDDGVGVSDILTHLSGRLSE